MSEGANITMNTPTASTAGGFLTSGSTPLPRDILERARERVKIAALVFVATWLFVVTMNEGVARFAYGTPLLERLWAPRQTLLTLVGLFASAGMAFLASRMKHRPELVLDVGLVFEVFNALLISLITEWYPRSDAQAVSWVCVTIVLWPAIAPSSPRKTLVAALAAATTIPLGIWYGLTIHPVRDANWFILLWLILPGYVCAALAVVPANVIRKRHRSANLRSSEKYLPQILSNAKQKISASGIDTFSDLTNGIVIAPCLLITAESNSRRSYGTSKENFSANGHLGHFERRLRYALEMGDPAAQR